MKFPLREDLDLVTFRIFLRADSGVGPRLVDEVLRRATAAARFKLRTYIDDRDADLLELYFSLGFTETQQISVSVLSVAAEQPTATAEAYDEADDEIVQWQERCPEELIDFFAALCARMSADAPQAEAMMEEQIWDATRVRGVEKVKAEQGRETQVTAVRHRSSLEMVGYTVLSWHPDQPITAMQGDTLVVRADRGRGLGMRLKTENLRAAVKRWPSVERIYTGNAAENSLMLRINQEIGFVPDKTFRTFDLSL